MSITVHSGQMLGYISIISFKLKKTFNFGYDNSFFGYFEGSGKGLHEEKIGKQIRLFVSHIFKLKTSVLNSNTALIPCVGFRHEAEK